MCLGVYREKERYYGTGKRMQVTREKRNWQVSLCNERIQYRRVEKRMCLGMYREKERYYGTGRRDTGN